MKNYIRNIIRKVRRYIGKNWIFILAGILLEGKAIEFAYGFRGYMAVGGEIFVFPLFLVLIGALKQAIYFINYREGD